MLPHPGTGLLRFPAGHCVQDPLVEKQSLGGVVPRIHPECLGDAFIEGFPGIFHGGGQQMVSGSPGQLHVEHGVESGELRNVFSAAAHAFQSVLHDGDIFRFRSSGGLRTASVRVGGTELARTGLTETEAKRAGLNVRSVMAEGCDRPGICPNPQKITIKLVYEARTHQVVGAQAWGGKNVTTRINAIAVAIRAGMTTDALAQVDFCFSSVQSSIWDPIQIACGQAH